MPYSDAQKRATLKYRKENYARINLDLKKEKKEEYRAQAAARGLSLNAYIISLLEADRAPALSPAPAPAGDLLPDTARICESVSGSHGE